MKVAIQRSVEYRGAFMADILQYPREFLVWVDETGTDRIGYALRGQPAVCKQLLSRGTRSSAIVAMSSDGVEAYELLVGSTDSKRFFDFIRGSLIPMTQPFPGKNSIVIMDNCSIHHIQEVKDLFESVGVLLMYLPPYSPDFNPIEELFSYLKYYLKGHEELIQSLPTPLSVIEAALESVTSSKCHGWINDSGYA